MKWCPSCETEKTDSEFHKEAKRKDGLASQCKTCRSKHYQNTYPGKKDQIRRNVEAYRLVLATQVNALKTGPCMDCGGRFPPCAMDFDHRDGDTKLASVSRLIAASSWARIEAEIAKCDLVCANCHRIRTFERLQGAVPERPTELSAKQL